MDIELHFYLYLKVASVGGIDCLVTVYGQDLINDLIFGYVASCKGLVSWEVVYMSTVSPVFHTVGTVSICLKHMFRVGTFILKY